MLPTVSCQVFRQGPVFLVSRQAQLFADESIQGHLIGCRFLKQIVRNEHSVFVVD